jgi:hypothetical protein
MRKQAVDKAGDAFDRSPVADNANEELGTQTMTPEELQFLDLLAEIFVNHFVNSKKNERSSDRANAPGF